MYLQFNITASFPFAWETSRILCEGKQIKIESYLTLGIGVWGRAVYASGGQKSICNEKRTLPVCLSNCLSTT